MTDTVTDYNLDRSKTERVVSYQEIIINEGDDLYSTIEAVNADTHVKYSLMLSDGSNATPVIDLSGDTVKEYLVNVICADGGTVEGGGTYLPGEYAGVSADPEEGYVFGGWFVNNVCVSEDICYRFLVSTDTTISAKFISVDDCWIKMQEYLVMYAGQTVQPQVQVYPQAWAETISWSVETDKGIIGVDETGTITAYSEGTAYIIASICIGETDITARCRVDVAETKSVEGENEDIILDGIQVGTTKLNVEVYSTDYTEFDILLKLPQNYAATAASTDADKPEELGVAISDAYFADKAMAEMFDLVT